MTGTIQPPQTEFGGYVPRRKATNINTYELQKRTQNYKTITRKVLSLRCEAMWKLNEPIVFDNIRKMDTASK